MDVIVPLPEEEVHVYYDEATGTHQTLERAGRVELHHEHVRLDLAGLATLSPRDRERLLGIRAGLVERSEAIAALRARTEKAVLAPLGPDQRIIRLHALLRDLELSATRIGTRAARVAEADHPFEGRAAKDARATIRLLAGSPEADTLASILAEAERVEAQRDRILTERYPYLSRLATHAVAARLLTLAGGIRELATAPAGRIQLLGAEAALFRHLRNPRQRPPKHGVIHEHPLMQRVPKRAHGKLARLLADKIAIAARVDYFGHADPEDIERTWNEIERAAATLSGARPSKP